MSKTILVKVKDKNMNNKDMGKDITDVSDCPYLFVNDPYYEIFDEVIKKSKPNEGRSFNVYDIKADFDYGEFRIFIKTSKIESYEIKFFKNSMNEFWNFLESVVLINEPLFFRLFYNRFETFLYINSYDKRNVRFIILNTEKNDRKVFEKTAFRHNYKESEVISDIIINRKRFVQIFYEKLYETFKKESVVAFFEPPFIDFDFWVKDSDILKEFLEK